MPRHTLDRCPECGSDAIRKNGYRTKDKLPLRRCKTCGRQFTPGALPPNPAGPVRHWRNGFVCPDCGNDDRKRFRHSEFRPSGSEQVRCTCCNKRFVPFPKIQAPKTSTRRYLATPPAR